MVNTWLRTSYTIEEISTWPMEAIDALVAEKQGLEPPPKGKPEKL